MSENRQKLVRKTHCDEQFFSMDNPLYVDDILTYTVKAVHKDLEPNGDITIAACFHKEMNVRATLIAKSKGILAGMKEVDFFLSKSFSRAGRKKNPSTLLFKPFKKDGDQLLKNDMIALLEGSFADILKIERTILNLLQRMSGVATLTSTFVGAVPKKILITPTRKTLWGSLDKWACVVGGGGTHRLNLSDAILVKDTHLDILKHDFEKLFQNLSHTKKKGRFIEVEIENPSDALQVAQLFQNYKSLLKLPFFIMFDNMAPELIRKTLQKMESKGLSENIYFEASGGINLKNIDQYAKSGVDVLSIGALTHSAPALDISLKIKMERNF